VLAAFRVLGDGVDKVDYLIYLLREIWRRQKRYLQDVVSCVALAMSVASKDMKGDVLSEIARKGASLNILSLLKLTLPQSTGGKDGWQGNQGLDTRG